MKNNTKKTILFLIVFGYASILCSQIYGPELFPDGSFGTIADGINGDDLDQPNSRSKSIYPNNAGKDIPVHYQPIKEAYSGWNYVFGNVEDKVNPGVTIGYSLGNKTTYTWGMTASRGSDPIFFPKTNGTVESNTQVPLAPDSDGYIVATSTNGMFNPESLNGVTWNVVYNKYETDFNNPSNFFLIVNASTSADIFYQENIDLVPGQAYRLSVDIARLNKNSNPPNVSFLVGTTTIGSTGNILDTTGEWTNYNIDFVAGANSQNTYLAFKNNIYMWDGNDLALDNFSVKAIVPQIKIDVSAGECAPSFTLTNAILDAYPTDKYLFQWKIRNESMEYVNAPGASTNPTYTSTTPGTYKLYVYTSTTSDNPMISNEITIIEISEDCLGPEKRPLAYDDEILTTPGSRIEYNILYNDKAHSGEGAIESGVVTVSFYEINSVKYAVGERVIVTDASNNRIGVLTIAADGTLVLQTTPDFLGEVPVINYTIIEEGGSHDSANIYITVCPFQLTIDASCVSCPVQVVIRKDETGGESLDTNPNNYTFTKSSGSMSNLTKTYDPTENAIIITFHEAVAGENTYTIEHVGGDVFTFQTVVSPDLAYWKPNNSVTGDAAEDWNNKDNWETPDGEGSPIWCTDVVITSNASHYPVLSDGNECRDITFQHGASVGKIHKLHYRRAFVEFSPETNIWSMISAPLKYLYTADYHADTSWGSYAGIDPRIYLRYFKANSDMDGETPISVGDFSTPLNNLKDRLTLGQSFVINFGENGSSFDGTYRFPRLTADGEEITYMYHYEDNGEWVTDNSAGDEYAPFQLFRGNEEAMDSITWTNENKKRLGREAYTDHWGGDHRYRFIYETDALKTIIDNNLRLVEQIDISSLSALNGQMIAGNSVAIGNPLMSYVDFKMFVEDNLDLIQPYFRIFDGVNYQTYLSTEHMPALEIEGSETLIRPMESFIIHLKEDTPSLAFIPEHLSIAPDMNNLRSTRKSSNQENVVRVQLNMGDKENTALVVLSSLASDEYDPGEDIYKLFSDEKSLELIHEKFLPVDIYTVSDETALEINSLNTDVSEKIIPIGIKTKLSGPATITVEGTDKLSAFSEIFLIDSKEDKRYDLKESNQIFFERDMLENNEGRFYLYLRNNGSEITQSSLVDNGVYCYQYNKSIIVNSPACDIIEVSVFDVSGKLIYKKNNVFSTSTTLYPEVKTGVYMVRTKTVREDHTKKMSL
ncbi:MAG: T9SS type A sorting domain-containing protein [Candidatus Azobacteroides sp.]|nr:T9SS type A sorting domain-containing protein [Candidatus Azobacteroides sp.]